MGPEVHTYEREYRIPPLYIYMYISKLSTLYKYLGLNLGRLFMFGCGYCIQYKLGYGAVTWTLYVWICYGDDLNLAHVHPLGSQQVKDLSPSPDLPTG